MRRRWQPFAFSAEGKSATVPPHDGGNMPDLASYLDAVRERLEKATNRCPTCGSFCAVHQADEGTCSFDPLSKGTITRLLALAEAGQELKKAGTVLLKEVEMLSDSSGKYLGQVVPDGVGKMKKALARWQAAIQKVVK